MFKELCFLSRGILLCNSPLVCLSLLKCQPVMHKFCLLVPSLSQRLMITLFSVSNETQKYRFLHASSYSLSLFNKYAVSIKLINIKFKKVP